MTRARNIKPGFYRNEYLAECSIWARYISPGLWMMADREGRLEYRPKKIKIELLGYDNVEVEPLLRELEQHGFIEIYEVDGHKYIQVVNFLKHQNPHHREAQSALPPNPGRACEDGVPVQGNESNEETSIGNRPSESPGLASYQPRARQNLGMDEPRTSRADSLIPDSFKTIGTNVVVSEPRARGQTVPSDDDSGGEDFVPKDPAQWCRYFAEQHGVELDARSVHDRKKAWPIFAAWTQAGITVGQMDTAVAKAHAEATEPIAFLPAYVDRVLATMRAPPQRHRDTNGKSSAKSHTGFDKVDYREGVNADGTF